jgi:hypothetical protein
MLQKGLHMSEEWSFLCELSTGDRESISTHWDSKAKTSHLEFFPGWSGDASTFPFFVFTSVILRWRDRNGRGDYVRLGRKNPRLEGIVKWLVEKSTSFVLLPGVLFFL